MLRDYIPGTVFRDLTVAYNHALIADINGGSKPDENTFEYFLSALNVINLTENNRHYIEISLNGEEYYAVDDGTGKNRYITPVDIGKMLLFEIILSSSEKFTSNHYFYNIITAFINQTENRKKLIRSYLEEYLYSNVFINYMVEQGLLKEEEKPYYSLFQNLLNHRGSLGNLNTTHIEYWFTSESGKVSMDVAIEDIRQWMNITVKTNTPIGRVLKYLMYDFDVFLDNDMTPKPGTDLYSVQVYVNTTPDKSSYRDDEEQQRLKAEAAAKAEQQGLSNAIKNGNTEAVINYLYSHDAIALQYDLTPNTYYSGGDAYLFINNKHVAEVTYIDWEIKEVTKPIYGYASYTWDAIAKGQRMVTGVMKINFTKTNYMNAILQKTQEALTKNANDNSIYAQLKTMTAEEKKAFIGNVLNNSSDAEITALAERMDELLWAPGVNNEVIDRTYKPYFNNPNQTSEAKGFDVIIAWGNELFKIADLPSNGSETVTIINEVHFVSESSKVEISGENVVVTYEYVAKDLNNTLLTAEDKIKINNL